MTHEIMTTDEIEELLGRELTDLETVRVQLDIDRLVKTLEGWCRRKFTEEEITDERHIIAITGQTLDGLLKWAPVKEFTGLRYQSLDSPLQTSLDGYWDVIGFRRGAIIYVSYVTDISDLADYLPIIKSIISEIIIGLVLKPDAVKFGVLAGYSVEGLSITYGSGSGKQAGDYGDIGRVSLQPLVPIRRRIIK